MIKSPLLALRARRYIKARVAQGSRRSAIAVHSHLEQPKVQAMTIRPCLVGLLVAVMLPGLAHARPRRPAHVVVVIEENQARSIIGNPDAAFITSLPRMVHSSPIPTVSSTRVSRTISLSSRALPREYR